MKDENYLGDESTDLDAELANIPDAPPPQGYEANQWDTSEPKVSRGNRGVLIILLLLLLVGGAMALIWYNDHTDYQKWNGELKKALKLPDGEFETALRALLAKTDREDVIAQAAFELGNAKDPKAAPELTKLVSRGGEVGREAAKALAKIGGSAGKTAVDAIFLQMQQSKEYARAEYAWALCSLGDNRGFTPLLEIFGQRVITPKSLPDFDADILVRMGTTDKLIQMSASPEPMLRIYAAMELGFRTDMDVVPALLKLVRDEKPDVAEAAATSLGRTNDERAGPALIELMKQKQDMRDKILSVITQAVGSPGLEAIYKNLGADPKLRYKVIGKFRSLRDPRSKDFLYGVLKEEYSESDQAAGKPTNEIYNQALWTLEDLGDPRIGAEMFAKTQWKPVTEEAMPDAAARYRENDIARKIANGAVVWFGRVRPESASKYLQKVYDANKPYENTPECAQRVTVDIGPLMDAMGRSGDTGLCPIITPYLDQDKGFYFQAAAMALARLNCPGAMESFMKRMVMTGKERKDGSFSPLEETRDWMMEDRLQERRNSIMALKFFGNPKPGKDLMKIVLDPEDDQELRKEAATSLAYCADEAIMGQILETIRDTKIDVVARAALISGLWFKPTDQAVTAMFEILEQQASFEFIRPAAIAIGESANPAYADRVNKLLEGNDAQRRGGTFAAMLGGNTDQVDKIIDTLKGQENRLILRDWYEDHPVFLTKEMFESGRMYTRMAIARKIADKTNRSDYEILWPWKHLMGRLKSGWEDGPNGLTALQIRELLVQAVRSDETNRKLAASILAGLGERGYLLALQGEKGPQGEIARATLRELSGKPQ